MNCTWNCEPSEMLKILTTSKKLMFSHDMRSRKTFDVQSFPSVNEHRAKPKPTFFEHTLNPFCWKQLPLKQMELGGTVNEGNTSDGAMFEK